LFYSTKYSVKGLDLVERDLVSDFEIVGLETLVEFCYFVTLTLPLEVWEYITLSWDIWSLNYSDNFEETSFFGATSVFFGKTSVGLAVFFGSSTFFVSIGCFFSSFFKVSAFFAFSRTSVSIFLSFDSAFFKFSSF